MKTWFAVYTQPNKEAVASHHLQKQGFEILLPKYMKQRRHARKTELVEAPLFPRYLFVGVVRELAQWRVIRSTIGVTDLVQFGIKPAEVPLSLVNALRLKMNEDGLLKLTQKFVPSRGDKLQIVAGAFCESVGIFEKMDSSDRVTMLLDLMGRSVRLKMSLENVNPTI